MLSCFSLGFLWTFLWAYVHIYFDLNQLLNVFWDNLLQIPYVRGNLMT